MSMGRRKPPSTIGVLFTALWPVVREISLLSLETLSLNAGVLGVIQVISAELHPRVRPSE